MHKILRSTSLLTHALKGLYSSIISNIPYPDLEYVCPVSLSSIDSCTDDETDSEDGDKESFQIIDSLVPCLQGSIACTPFFS